DVPQEGVPQAVAGMRAGDEARHVGEKRGAGLCIGVVAADEDAEVRRGGREGIGTDARGCLRQRCQERRLPRIWGADQPNVGDRLELELDPALLAWIALLVMARCAVGGRGEVHVAAPSPAATGDHHSLSSSEQLPNRLAALTAHDRPGRNAEHQIGAVPAVRAPPPTTSTWFGAEMPRLA